MTIILSWVSPCSTSTLRFKPLILETSSLVLGDLFYQRRSTFRTDIGSNQYVLWYPGAFDPAIFEYTEVTKQPFGPGELLTAGTGNITAPDFKGPVLVVTCSMFINLLKVCVLLTTNRPRRFLLRRRPSCYWYS